MHELNKTFPYNNETLNFSHLELLFKLCKSPLITPSCQVTYHVLYFFYVNLTITMNPLSSKAHSLAQTRQTKHRTNRTENQHERATKRILAILAPKFRACADVIQLCREDLRKNFVPWDITGQRFSPEHVLLHILYNNAS